MTEDDDPLSPQELSALRRPDSPPAAIEEATVAQLRAMGVLRARRSGFVGRPLPWLLALAGSFLLGFFARPLLPSGGQPADSRHEFLLLLYGEPRERPGKEHRDEYVAWARGLASRGQLSSDGELSGEVETLNSGPREGGSGEEPIGFFILRARDRTEALQLSAGCPHLRYGRVELRPFLVRP
jgi:hypothetical protein